MCLVRASDKKEAKERIIKNLVFYQLWKPEYVDRIVPVRVPFLTLDNLRSPEILEN